MTKENTFAQDYQKLIKEVGAVEKDGLNPHFKNKYMVLEDVLIAVKRACSKSNFYFTQVVNEGLLITNLIHIPSGEKIESSMKLLLPSNDMQKYGSAITYARRYSLVTMLGISDKDDDGNDAAQLDINALFDEAKKEAGKGSASYTGWCKSKSKEEQQYLRSENVRTTTAKIREEADKKIALEEDAAVKGE